MTNESSELIGILRNKETIEEFKEKYFNGENVHHRTLQEFYSDYINSRMTLNKYIEATTSICE